MRFFVHCAYDGRCYCGWQKQPNAISVQETIERALSTIIQIPTEIVGCGRTDAGVHASQFYFHFDLQEWNGEKDTFLYKVNSLLPKDIVLYDIFNVSDEEHARFSAISRAYEYYITLEKPIFGRDYMYWWKYRKVDDKDALLNLCNQISALLSSYQEWFPFCKTNSDIHNYKVQIFAMYWEWKESQLIFHVKANRFLRGMIRLLVGAHLRILEGKLTLDQLKNAMEHQSTLPKAWSVPGHALFLSEVKYTLM